VILRVWKSQGFKARGRLHPGQEGARGTWEKRYLREEADSRKGDANQGDSSSREKILL
jgi:hypothetical protein